jgi:WD40 repeat protein
MRGGYLSTELKPKEADQPLDTVSCIIWDLYREDPGFITSSWDGYLRYYMIKPNGDVDKVWQIFLQHPVLCCDINENNVVFGGLATGDVVAVSLENSGICHLGRHDAPINGIFWIREKGCLITTGFDNLLKIWTL